MLAILHQIPRFFSAGHLALLFEAMGNTNYLPATIAAWSPDLIFALAGGYMILKVPT